MILTPGFNITFSPFLEIQFPKEWESKTFSTILTQSAWIVYFDANASWLCPSDVLKHTSSSSDLLFHNITFLSLIELILERFDQFCPFFRILTLNTLMVLYNSHKFESNPKSPFESYRASTRQRT